MYTTRNAGRLVDSKDFETAMEEARGRNLRPMFDEAVYIVHAFEKRTAKTAAHDVRLARDRYRALVKKRASDAKKK